MRYEEIVRQLSELHHGMQERPNLATAEFLANHLGYPERAFPTVHIAGTNGKGSVSTKIARALEYSGYRVGLFTSPHIVSYRERISINQEWITEQEVVDGVERLFRLCQELKRTAFFFEVTTFLAFEYFQKHCVDVAVIEAGLGGLNDTTNVVVPELSVITTIGRDHMEILGDTLDDIAYQKAGIIKPSVPVVLGSSAVRTPILLKAQQVGAALYVVEKEQGFYDNENTAIARQSLKLLQESFEISDEAMEKGLAHRPACRFERRGNFIFDVAHNPEGIAKMLETLDEELPGVKVRCVVGFSKDKEIAPCLDLIAERAEHIYCISAPTSRAACPFKLKDLLMKRGYERCTASENVAEIVQTAAREAHAAGDFLIICGTFYIMGPVFQALGIPADTSDSVRAKHRALVTREL